MLKKILFALLFLVLVSAALAQESLTGRLTYADGEKVELLTGKPEELDQAFRALLEGDRDGKLEMFLDGKPDGSLARTGGQVTVVGAEGETLTMTLEEARANWAEAKAKGQLSACKSNLKNIATALEMWAVDHGGKYPDKLESLTPHYLIYLPTCPTGRAAYSFKLLAEPVWYELQCHNDHSPANCATGYPAYDGRHGLLESDEDRQQIEEPSPAED